LKAGKLHGMRNGSKFAIYEAGTKKVGELGKLKLADAEIINVNMLDSELKLTKPIKPEVIGIARAFEVSRNLEVDTIKISTESLPLQERKIVEEALKDYPFVKIGGQNINNYDLNFRVKNKNDVEFNNSKENIVLESKNGSVTSFSISDLNLKENLKQELQREIRWKTVKGLENANSDLSVEMRIVPVNIETSNDGKRNDDDFGTPKEAKIGTSGLEFSIGEYFRIEVKNSSNIPVYISIFSLSNGFVGGVFPKNLDKDITDINRIPNNSEWKPLAVFRATPPIIIEGFKLIATKEKHDFSYLIDPTTIRKGDARGETIPLEKLFKDLAVGQRREIQSPPESWATTTISYKVTCSQENGINKCCWSKEDKKPIVCENNK
jgi:hypothetical protein